VLIKIVQSLLIAVPVIYLLIGFIFAARTEITIHGGRPPFYVMAQAYCFLIFITPTLQIASMLKGRGRMEIREREDD
jgi:hypothetical protein